MAVEGCGLLAMQDEAAHPAVELPGEQQADDRGLDVLLIILVSVERIPQVCRDVIWKKICATFEYNRAATNYDFFCCQFICSVF